MGKSYKKAIIKDNGYGTKLYRRITKRSIKNKLKDQLLLNDLDELELKHEKNIINDYTRCDWIVNYENILCDRVDEKLLNQKRRK